MTEVESFALPDDLTLEEALKRLDDIVADLEQDELALEDALAAYEEGVALAAFCEEQLQEAELRMEEIKPEE